MKRWPAFILLVLILCASSSVSAKGRKADIQGQEAPKAAEMEVKPETQAEPAPEPAPLPHFVRYKHELPALFLKQKREHRYFTPMPIIGVDPDTGINFGALVNFYDNGSKDDPFFRISPYRQQIALVALGTSKKMYQFNAFFDQPYIMDTPWRVRSEAEFLNNPVQYYFGQGENGQQLIYPGTGQVYGSYDAYNNALNQVAGGQTYAKYDLYGMKRLSFMAVAEYDLLGGLLRPLFGFRIANVWIDDYTGDTVHNATVLPTHIRQDCDSGRAVGCGGGFDNFVKLGLTLDTRDFEPDPGKGILAELTAELSPRFLGSAFNYGRLTSTLQGYGTIFSHKELRAVLAGRFLYSWQFGDVPFYSMNTLALTERDRYGLGGLRTLRGYKQDRFIGHVSMLANMELRTSFAEFDVFKQHMKLMLVPFFDAGRAFNGNNDVSFKDWHIDGGAGLRLAWNLSTVICFDYGFATEGSAFYMDISHQF